MPRPRKSRPPLRKIDIDKAMPGPKDKFLWDGAEHGLGVKITPAGAKVFVFQKVVRNGSTSKLKRITLG
jgi:hypothetical protein